MDLGIRGRTALVCAASKGLGKACAQALADEGVNLVITARGRDDLEKPRRKLAAPPEPRSQPWPATSPPKPDGRQDGGRYPGTF